LDEYLERRLLAGSVRSPTAASEHSGLQNLGLADWLLSGYRYGLYWARKSHPSNSRLSDSKRSGPAD